MALSDNPYITICANCKWYQAEGDQWYNSYCSHPLQANKETIDFVTGETTFTGESKEKRPYAREINVDGKCVTYEQCEDASS